MSERKNILLAFVLVVLVLILNAVISYRAIKTIIHNERSARQSLAVKSSLTRVFSTLQDAETGQRGYIITGVERFLEPYKNALSKINDEFRNFEELSKEQPNHQERLKRIRRLANARLDVAQETIDLYRSGLAEAARNMIISERGKKMMDEIRREIVEGEAEEQALLEKRNAESNANSDRAVLTLGIVNFIAFSLVLTAFYLNHQALAMREVSQAALQKANAELEKRVRERTKQLEALNTELKRSNRELQDFAFVASHDLQEPLRKIQAFGDLLQVDYSRELGDEGRDFLTRMQKAAQRMHSYINDLLEFSRVTTGGQAFVTTDLDKVAYEVLDDLEGRVIQTGGRVEIGKLPTIEADPLQMRQLLLNLLGNALKFYQPNQPPVVHLDATLDDEFCHLTIADNGIGFDEKYLDRIFTPFQRLHGRSEYEGTGMGLAVCRKIVERHGGTITAESQPGNGSRFLVSLPTRHLNEAVPYEQ